MLLHCPIINTIILTVRIVLLLQTGGDEDGEPAGRLRVRDERSGVRASSGDELCDVQGQHQAQERGEGKRGGECVLIRTSRGTTGDFSIVA